MTQVSLPVTATDADDDTLSYSATGLPTGLSIDEVTGVISGTVPFGSDGTFPVTVTVTDGDASDQVSFDWTVAHTNRAPVVDSVVIDQSSPKTDDTLSVTVIATDPDGSDPVPGLPVVQGHRPHLRGHRGHPGPVARGQRGQGRLISVEVTASDGTLSSAPVSSSPVTVINTAPSVSTPEGQSSVEGDVISLGIQALDPDADTLSYSATGLPSGLDIDPSTGLISGTVATGSAGAHPVSITVSDGTIRSPRSFDWTVIPC